MNKIKQFLEKERTHAGWRFWLLFVIMTNVGFFPGLGLEKILFGEVNVYIATAFSGIGQAWVLSRHFPERGQWAIASALGWFVGGLLSERVLASLIPDISFTLNLFLFPIIAGGVMGIPLWLVLRRYLPQVGWWWILVSAIGPMTQFPGMVMGGVILWLMGQSSDNQ
ncbi:MAG: hypothetical protein HQ525_00350 [Anaerolineae bacterium]|nr:hypothetical protein [Anaerolineae bacterium]